MRILVVEPDSGSRELAAEIFREVGHDVVCAAAALDVARVLQERPDVLVTEWRFGEEVVAPSIRALRAEPALARLPVLLWTATDPRLLPPDLARDLAPLVVVAKPRVLPELLEALDVLAPGAADTSR